MSVITIQQDHQDGGIAFSALHLFRRESLRFGRGGGSEHADPHVDLAIAEGDDAVARCAGTIESLGHHWRLTNTCGVHTYVVEHTDPVAGYVRVRPGGRGLIIPFGTARVRIPGRDREYSFLVISPDLSVRERRESGEEEEDAVPEHHGVLPEPEGGVRG